MTANALAHELSTAGDDRITDSTHAHREPAAVEIDAVERRFGTQVALDRVSMRIERGHVHALLGPNGAGKTTLLRVLSGLLSVDGGSVQLLGVDVTREPQRLRGLIGLVPSGDRTFYLRLSGLENLVFFARLQGLRRRAAHAAARETLEAVGLGDAVDKRVGFYSHGMQKRLAMARAMLVRPRALLIDEATHDLDPEGALRIRELARAAADDGTAVLWATQRLDELRGLADRVTMLNGGRVRFDDSLDALTELTEVRHYVLRLAPAVGSARRLQERAGSALAGIAGVEALRSGTASLYRVTLAKGVAVGTAVVRLEGAGLRVETCRQERSEIEEAFLALATRDTA